MSWERRFKEQDDEIGKLIDDLCEAVDRAGMGRYEIRFFNGGHILIDLDAKPAKRRLLSKRTINAQIKRKRKP